MSRTGRGVLLALFTAVLWGTIPVAGKVALLSFEPVYVAAMRIAGAGVGLGVLLAVRNGVGVFTQLRKHPWMIVTGAVGISATYVLYFMGLRYTSPTAGQVVMQLASVFLFMWGALLFGERVTRSRGVGIALAVAGAVVVTWNGAPIGQMIGGDALLGNLMIAAGALTWSAYAAAQKATDGDVGSLVALAGVLLLAAVPAVPFVANPQPLLTGGLLAVGALAFLVANTLAAYTGFAEVLHMLDAGRAAVIVTFAPVMTVVAAWLLRDALPASVTAGALTPWTLTGTALVIGGVLLVSREPTGTDHQVQGSTSSADAQ